MKKTLIRVGLGIAFMIGGTYIVISYNGDKTEAKTSTQQVHKGYKVELDKTEAATSPIQQVHKVSQAELDKAVKNFNQIEGYQNGDDFFYYSMITMALQKLEFKGEENYKIPASVDVKRIQFDRANLQYLKNKAVELKASEPYQKILNKWLKGDFSNFENDYLTIRDLKGEPTKPGESPVLKVRTVEEEQEYIQHFFGDQGLQMNQRDWQ